MALLGYWPPTAHLVLVAACAATAWWRLESAPAVPSGATVQASLAVSGPEVAGGVPDTVAHDWQGDVEAVAARALFHPARLAKAEVAEVGASPAPTRPDPAAPAFTATLQMVGYFDQGGQRSAILKTVEDGHSHMVREGDEIAGARVQQINPDAVVIEAAGRETTLKLYPD